MMSWLRSASRREHGGRSTKRRLVRVLFLFEKRTRARTVALLTNVQGLTTVEGRAERRRRARLPSYRFDADSHCWGGVTRAGSLAADEGVTGLLDGHADRAAIRGR